MCVSARALNGRALTVFRYTNPSELPHVLLRRPQESWRSLLSIPAQKCANNKAVPITSSFTRSSMTIGTTIELSLKSLIRDARRLLNERGGAPEGDVLMDLWNTAQAVAP